MPRYSILIAPAFTLVLLVQPALAQDEEIAGKKVSEWVEILKTHKEVKFRRASIIALEVAGPKVKNVLDTLKEALAKDAEPQIRREVALCLGRMGADAKTAVDSLGEALKKDKDDAVREGAARALGDTLVEHAHTQVFLLAGALTDLNGTVRVAAAETLKKMGEKARPALDKIGAAAQDVKNDRFTRLYAVQIIARWGDELQGPLVLMKIAKETEVPPGVREAALDGLGRLAPGHMETPAILSAALADKSVSIRRAAAATLAAIDDKAAAAWPAVKKGLQDTDPQVRYQLYRVAGNVAKEHKEAVSLLVLGAQKDSTTENRLVAILELGELGSMASDALPALMKLADEEARPQLREAAQTAVGKIRGSEK